MRSVNCLFALLLMSAGQTESSEAVGPPAPARLEVKVPADAELFVDGRRTRSRGALRTLVTPPLPLDQTYAYELVAVWTEDGQRQERKRSPLVRGGEPTQVDFFAEEKWQAPPGVAYCPDLAYCEHVKELRRLDVAYPAKGKGPFPAVVVIHGTGPLAGGRKRFVPLIWQMAEKGYVGVTISFRHKEDGCFPVPCHDVTCAVRWLRGNAAKYQIDPTRIGALGFSGGGGLACLLGLCTGREGLEGDGGHRDQSSSVQAVVCYFPAVDMVELHKHYATTAKNGGYFEAFKARFLQGMLEKWLGGPPEKMPERYRQASPLTYARKGAPPMLFLHGTKDSVVPPAQSTILSNRLKALGGYVEMLLFHAEHDFDAINDFNARVAESAVWLFLDDHLRAKTRAGKGA
jgi:uncharacterized protein (TIGR03000 family)